MKNMPLPNGGDMSKSVVRWIGAALAVSAFSILGSQLGESQTTPKQPQPEQQAVSHAPDGWDRPVRSPAKQQTPGPAPRQDISGTWAPANGPNDGIHGTGPKSVLAERK